MGVREVLWSVVALLLIPFIVNQVSSRLEFSWSIWAAAAAGLVALGLFLTSNWVSRREWTGIAREHPGLAIVMTGLIVGCLGAGAAALLISTSRPRGDIAWNFEAAKPLQYFLAMVGGAGEESWVLGFQATGQNNMEGPISHVSGFIRSDITNAQFPMRLDVDGRLVRPEETRGIPRGAQFVVGSERFPSPDRSRRDEGMPASRFLVEFATFTFVFEYDGREFVRHFSNEEIRAVIGAFDRATQRSEPRVMRRP